MGYLRCLYVLLLALRYVFLLSPLRAQFVTMQNLTFPDGDSEDLLGKWFKYSGKRPDIFLCTKFGVKVTDKVYSMRSDPEYVREACERSLSRLGVDKIDLYYCHRVDLKTPIEKTMEVLVQLKKYVIIFINYRPNIAVLNQTVKGRLATLA